jgi:hypothetical protein
MVSSGFGYLAAVTALNARGVYKSAKDIEMALYKMQQAGVRPRSRDRLFSILTGAAEKLSMSVLLLGHNEAVHLVKNWGFGDVLVHTVDSVNHHSLPADFSHAMNSGVDHAKTSAGYHIGDSGSTNLKPTGAALATEYVTNKVGAAGRNARRTITYGR